MIAATARELGCTLLTQDRVLVEYGKQGHLTVEIC
jgi:predicted nucleic acid-binding protein